MKNFFSLAVTMLLAIVCHSQTKIADQSVPISVITREAIEKDGKFDINIVLAVPFGKGGENSGIGGGLSLRYNLGKQLNTVYTDANFKNIEDIEVLKNPRSTVLGADALSGVINLITTKEPNATENFYALETKRWNSFIGVGGNYFAGKEFDNMGFPYKTDPIGIGYASFGATYHPCMRGELSLEGGPATVIFKSANEFGYRVGLSGSIDFKKPLNYYAGFWSQQKPGIDWGIFAGLSYNKFNEVDPIYIGELGLKMRF